MGKLILGAFTFIILKHPFPVFNGLLAIDMPYFRGLFFKIGTLLILMGALLGLVYWRNRMKTKRLIWEQKLREEEQDRIRQRTAEDFHDEIGNKLTRIKLLASVAESKLKDAPKEVLEILEKIKKDATSLYVGAKDIIWSLQPESDFLNAVIRRVCLNTETLFEFSGIDFSFQQKGVIPENLKLPADYGRNIIMILKEATNNILKHAEAHKVDLSVVVTKRSIEILLEDDGKGFSFEDAANKHGNGLQNMTRRAERFGGSIQLQSDIGKRGTKIRLWTALPK